MKKKEREVNQSKSKSKYCVKCGEFLKNSEFQSFVKGELACPNCFNEEESSKKKNGKNHKKQDHIEDEEIKEKKLPKKNGKNKNKDLEVAEEAEENKNERKNKHKKSRNDKEDKPCNYF